MKKFSTKSSINDVTLFLYLSLYLYSVIVVANDDVKFEFEKIFMK